MANIYEELETKIVKLPDGRMLMLYRSCPYGQTRPAKGEFEAIIFSNAELDNYIYSHKEIFNEAPIYLRGKRATCKDYGEYLDRCKKRAVDWEKFSKEYPHMYAEEILGWKVHAIGRNDFNPPQWYSKDQFRSLIELHGGSSGIIAMAEKLRTRDLQKISEFMRGKYNSEGIKFCLGKKKKQPAA